MGVKQKLTGDIVLQKDRYKDKQKVLGICNSFKKEYSDYFHGLEVSNYITQPLWYSMFLARRRLNRIGINGNYYEKKKMLPLRTIIWHADGKNVGVNLGERTYYVKEFKKDNVVIGKFSERSRITMTMMDSIQHGSNYVCPNCGNEANIEELLKGCPCCQTKFQLNDFKEKITAFYQRPDHVGTISRNIILGSILAILSYVGVVAWALSKSNLLIQILIFLFGLLLPICIFGITFIIAGVKAAIPIFKTVSSKVISLTQFENKMRKVDPYFSVDHFMATLDYKLKMIHFADNPIEIEPLVPLNMSMILNRYANVIDCTLVKGNCLSYTVDDLYQNVTVYVRLRLLTFDGKRVKGKRERLVLVLKKKKNATTRLGGQIIHYQCNHCGGSLNLLKGGVCEHCGSNIDLVNYDFVIQNYRIFS